MEYGGGMNELPYPSDLTAAQWALIEPLLPAPRPKGRKRRVDQRKITNAIAANIECFCRCAHVLISYFLAHALTAVTVLFPQLPYLVA
jgi:hypothetical protein